MLFFTKKDALRQLGQDNKKTKKLEERITDRKTVAVKEQKRGILIPLKLVRSRADLLESLNLLIAKQNFFLVYHLVY